MNLDPQNDGLYLRLDLDVNATKEDVKSNFFKAVRKFPPEQKPQQFKNIREAYDTLINDQSRKEYDSRLQFGAEINDLEEQIKLAENEEDTERIIKLLKKLIVIAPKVSIYKNRLGLQYLNSNKPEEASKQFDKAINLNPENRVFILNLGYAEQGQGNYLVAEKQFKKSWNLDRDDYSAPRALAQMYFYDMDEKEKAHNVLDQSIEADGVIDFQDFFCIFDKVHMYTFSDDGSSLELELQRILAISVKKEEKEFSAFMLLRTSDQLYKQNIFDLALKFSEAAILLDPDNDKIQEYNVHLNHELKFIEEFRKVMESIEVHELVKTYINILFSWHFEEIDEPEYRERIFAMGSYFDKAMKTKPDKGEIQNSLRYIKEHYNIIYELNTDFFNLLINDVNPHTYYRANCPHCGKEVTTSWLEWGDYNCPHCSKDFKYNIFGFSSCFITTSTCLAIGKNDNCVELKSFRLFRDNWLIKQADGIKLIKQYYRIAPKIVLTIDSLRNSKEIYLNIWSNYLNVCYKLILIEDFFKAKMIYIDLVKYLEREYL